jgi:GNAT superfamily N-acetyltransferase
MQIRYLTQKDINRMIDLHLEHFSGPSIAIGRSYVTGIYRQMFVKPDRIIPLGIFTGAKLIGQIIALRSPADIAEIMNPPITAPILRAILIALWTGRVTIIEIINRILFEYRINTVIEPEDTFIGIIVVNSGFRRHGIGKSLFNGLRKYTKSKRIWVDAREDNPIAVSFYKHLGFRVRLAKYHAVLLEH